MSEDLNEIQLAKNASPLTSMKKDSAQFYTDPSFSGLHTMSASFLGHRFAPHMHDELMIGAITEGVQTFMRDRKTHLAPQGSMSIINPGDIHTGEPGFEKRLVYRAIYIPVKVLLTAQSQLDLPAELLGFQDAVIRDERLWVALEQYHHALRNEEFTIVRESRMYSVLRILLSEHAGERGPERAHKNGWQQAHKMRDILHGSRELSPTIKDLADAVNLNPFQTIRMFRETFGVTPHAYLLSLKISRAKELLRSGTTISEVAMELGFVDQSHLHRNFKKMTGATPGEYRTALIATCRGGTRNASRH